MKLQIALDLFTLKILRTFFTSSRKNMLLDRWKLEKRHKTKRKSCVMCSAFDAIFATTAMMIIMMKDDKYTCRHHHHIHCQRHFLIAFSRCDLFLIIILCTCTVFFQPKVELLAAYFTGELDDGIHIIKQRILQGTNVHISWDNLQRVRRRRSRRRCGHGIRSSYYASQNNMKNL